MSGAVPSPFGPPVVAAAPEPPISWAVLVPDPDKPGGWHLLYVNGDKAAARAQADEWSREHLNSTAVLMAYADHVGASIVTRWAKGE